MYDIYFDLNNMHQVVDDAKTEEFWLVGESFSFDIELDLPEQEDDYAVIVKRSNGLNCNKCGELFPYAEPNQKDGTLVCYSCRNYG
jgi:formylmethanofuran dehydrogenase subunit E